jgi:uncharacterized protein YjiS (DUF1127 family)
MFTLTKTAPALTCPPALTQRSLLTRLAAIHHLRRSRKALADLSPEQMADIGMTPEQARQEARRPFWDAPRHWYL